MLKHIKILDPEKFKKEVSSTEYRWILDNLNGYLRIAVVGNFEEGIGPCNWMYTDIDSKDVMNKVETIVNDKSKALALLNINFNHTSFMYTSLIRCICKNMIFNDVRFSIEEIT